MTLFSKMLLRAKIEIKVDDSYELNPGRRKLRSALFDSHHYNDTKIVSFCTVVDSSDDCLIETLQDNLLANHRDRTQVEFVVFVPKNWHSLETVKSRFSEELRSSYLKIAEYHKEIDEQVLRNLCFQRAQGMILVNLESGDFTGQRAGNFIYHELVSDPFDSVLWFKHKWRIPSKIAVWRDSFFEVGGFDEGIKNADQCFNLIQRLNLYGIETKIRSNKYFTHSIVKPPWSFFRRQAVGAIKKLKMTRLDQSDVYFVE